MIATGVSPTTATAAAHPECARKPMAAGDGMAIGKSQPKTISAITNCGNA